MRRNPAMALFALVVSLGAWAAPETMRGVTVGEGGSLSVQTLPVPKPGAGEVLLKVRAAGVNPVDWKAAGGRVGQVPGTDVAGVIVSLGEGVSGWKPGEQVLGFARQSGSYAEFAVVPVNSLARKSRKLTFEEAAGVPIAAETAYRALHEAGKLEKGQTVLVHGAAGGVGSAAVQIAKAAGARVIGTASANNLDFLRSIGADEVIDYRAQKFEDVVKNVDLVLNTANVETSVRSIGIVREGGVLVTVVGTLDAAACEAAKIRCAKPDRSVGPTNAEMLARVMELADAGKFKVNVDGVFPMEQAAQAWQKSRDGHTRGKLIIQVSPGPTMKHQSQLDVLYDAMRKQKIHSLEYVAHGRYYQFGQAPAPELPWPAFDVDEYVATLDFERGAVHAKYHRVQVQEPGRARPHSEQTQDQYAVAGVTWNLAPGPVPMPANLAERNAELWASPLGFVRAAFEHDAKIEVHKDGGFTLRFVLDGIYRYEGDLTGTNELISVRTFIDSPVLGDTPIEFRYLDYRDFDGVRFPMRIERYVAGMPWYELTVTSLKVNVAKPFTVPPEIAANPTPSVATIAVTELAPGLLVFGGGSHNSVIVEQGQGIFVIEAPLSEQRSEAVIAKVRELFPGKPIRGVVNTHAHFDHAGGLRTYVDEGIAVITLSRNAKYYARAWATPHTLNPDRLARSKRKPVFDEFTGSVKFEDAQHPFEVHEITGSGHNDAFAMVYLPKDKVLIEADAWTPLAAGAAPPPQVNPLWVNLYENLARLKLDVQRVAPLHGAVQDFAALRAAVDARTN